MCRHEWMFRKLGEPNYLLPITLFGTFVTQGYTSLALASRTIVLWFLHSQGHVQGAAWPRKRDGSTTVTPSPTNPHRAIQFSTEWNGTRTVPHELTVNYNVLS
jgi:hypothetical protein